MKGCDKHGHMSNIRNYRVPSPFPIQSNAFNESLGKKEDDARHAANDLARVFDLLDELMKGTPYTKPIHKAATLARLFPDAVSNEKEMRQIMQDMHDALGQTLEQVEKKGRASPPGGSQPVPLTKPVLPANIP